MNLKRRFSLMERKTGLLQGEDKSPKTVKNPYNRDTNINIPRYMVDYIDSNSVTVDKFNPDTLNNLLTGMKVESRGRMPKRTKACLNQDASEDVVITFK